MITKGMLNNIKRLDVSNNSDFTKERVIALWDEMTKEQKAQVDDYDVSKATINRTKTFGNISVKVAAALALVTGADPYYLTAESDENNVPATEDTVREFLIYHGYERILISADSTDNMQPEEKINTKDIESETVTVTEPFIVEEFIIPKPEAEEVIKPDVISIQEFADMQMAKLSNAEKKSIFDMPEDDFTYLLKTLELQSKYTAKAKNLLGFIRLILIR